MPWSIRRQQPVLGRGVSRAHRAHHLADAEHRTEGRSAARRPVDVCARSSCVRKNERCTSREMTAPSTSTLATMTGRPVCQSPVARTRASALVRDRRPQHLSDSGRPHAGQRVRACPRPTGWWNTARWREGRRPVPGSSRRNISRGRGRCRRPSARRLVMAAAATLENGEDDRSVRAQPRGGRLRARVRFRSRRR